MSRAGVVPMLATLVKPKALPDGWVYEPKLDGMRTIATVTSSGVSMVSRTGHLLHDAFPEVADALAGAVDGAAVLDGELVAIDPHTGLSNFSRLQPRIRERRPPDALIRRVPVELWLFDCLEHGRKDIRRQPWHERRKTLERVVTPGDTIHLTPVLEGTFESLYRKACRSGAEGLIGKRVASPYQGKRSRDWVKLKCVAEQELVVVGWTDPRGSRVGFGALLLGYYEGTVLRYAGKVGTGFDDETLDRLSSKLESLGRRTSALDDPSSAREPDVHWVTPSMVVEVGFTEWTRDGYLRHPRFLGIRTDKDAKDVVRERAVSR